jgi:mannose-6-phosphate isomerase-like protein (cupin superfamily)
MGNAPVSLSRALAAFSDVYSPRIVAQVNDYDVRIAHFRGEHVWHVHEHTDEFLLVLDGQVEIWLREDGRVDSTTGHHIAGQSGDVI